MLGGLGKSLLAWLQSTQGRLIFFSLLLTLVPIGSVAALVFSQARDSLHQQIGANVLQVAQMTGVQVQHLVDERLRDVAVLGHSSPLDSPEITLEQQAAFLRAIYDEARSAYHGLHIVSPEGDVRFSAGHGTSFDPEAFWFRQAAVGVPSASDVYPDESGDFVLAFAAPIGEPGDGAPDVLVAQIEASEVLGLVEAVEVGAAGEVVLVNRQGQIIAARENEDVFMDVSGLPPFQAALRGERGWMIAPGYDTGRPALYAYLLLEGTMEWLALAQLPVSELDAPIMALALETVLITLAAAAVIAVGMVFLSRSIVRPIERFTLAARQLAGGNYKISLPVYREDEVGQLAASLRQMVASIQVRDSQLVGHNTELEAEIAERRLAEEALREQTRRNEAILQTTPDGFLALDAEGRILEANPAYADLVGYAPEALIGMNIVRLDGQFTPEEVARRIAAADAAAGHFETKHVHRDGHLIDVEISLCSVEIGEERAVFIFARDITGRKRAEEERTQLQQQVIEAQQQSIRELSTPIIPIMDRIIVMPLIGSIDTVRSRDITRALLKGISEYRAKVVILDVTGVPIVDSGVAGYLDKTIQAARLKGTETIITGVTDAVAEAIIDLGIDWSDVKTLRNLQAGLVMALNVLGMKVKTTDARPAAKGTPKRLN